MPRLNGLQAGSNGRSAPLGNFGRHVKEPDGSRVCRIATCYFHRFAWPISPGRAAPGSRLDQLLRPGRLSSLEFTENYWSCNWDLWGFIVSGAILDITGYAHRANAQRLLIVALAHLSALAFSSLIQRHKTW